MAQLDVFDNPVAPMRRVYPLVVVLQADVAETGVDRIVAPLALRSRLPTAKGRLFPQVTIDGTEYLVLVPGLTTLRTTDLKSRRGQLTRHREAIVAALDYLFLGV